MSKNDNYLLSKYLNQYKKNPTSRVFAPLAEAYRKLGMLEEAFDVLEDGLKYHQGYTLAHIVLGNCYFDKGETDQCYRLLKPLVEGNLDNIKLQNLYAKTCEKLHYIDEALQSYKYALFLNPRDKEAAQKVQELEESAEMKERYQIKKSNKSSLEEVIEAPSNDEDWVTIDLANTGENDAIADVEIEEQVEDEEVNLDDFDQWSMEKSSDAVEEETNKNLKDSEEESLNISFDNEKEEEPSSEDETDESEEPFVTNTLVDIYISQRHYSKAKSLLEKIIETNPGDERSKKKLKKVLSKMSDNELSVDYKSIEIRYMKFLNELKARAKHYTQN